MFILQHFAGYNNKRYNLSNNVNYLNFKPQFHELYAHLYFHQSILSLVERHRNFYKYKMFDVESDVANSICAVLHDYWYDNNMINLRIKLK